MSSVFRKDDQKVVKPNRNPYDKTFVKNLSVRFGELIPVFCQPVMNGETVSVRHKHNFNFMPLVFPVQTRVRASVQYFYVRNRNVWKDWQDFQFKMKPNLIPPYLKFNESMKRDMLRVGGFLDNIGCPVTVLEDIGRAIQIEALPAADTLYRKWYNPYTNTYSDGDYVLDLENADYSDAVESPNPQSYIDFSSVPLTADGTSFVFRKFRYPILAKDGAVSYRHVSSSLSYYFLVKCIKSTDSAKYVSSIRSSDSVVTSSAARPATRSSLRSSDSSRRSSTVGGSVRTSTKEQVVETTSLGEEIGYFIIACAPSDVPDMQNLKLRDIPGWQLDSVIGYYIEGAYADNDASNPYVLAWPDMYFHLGGLHLSDVRLLDLPYANIVQDTEKHIRVSSFVPRHFESIYNAFYRNAENNPFKINGQPEYNKYIANTDGGAETYNFPRRFANWQDDAFTTALHTPQHGEAPLVGLVNQSSELPYRVTFANDDGTNTTVHMGYDQNDGSVKIYHNAKDADRDGYVGQLEDALLEAVKFGITINDFRNVNSFQRWLENNVRKGYKYRDQIKAHYGVSVSYDVLDMPEYLGGTSRDMNVNQVTQTTQNDEGVLGDYAGQAWIEGESEHSITKYCDEDGYIIGILHIMPMASYSQLIPKHLLRDSAFDWFSPEFGKIGMQPILNREIAPVASFYRGNGSEVFGYNRPWYDLLDCVDTVHGKFRTDFRNFIINRVFDDVPTLSEDFLVYDPDQVNNIFYVDDDEDKILGQILFDYKVRIPVPLHGIAALE